MAKGKSNVVTTIQSQHQQQQKQPSPSNKELIEGQQQQMQVPVGGDESPGISLQFTPTQIQRTLPMPIFGVPAGLELFYFTQQIIVKQLTEDADLPRTALFELLDPYHNRPFNLRFTLPKSCSCASTFTASCLNYSGEKVFNGKGRFRKTSICCCSKERLTIGQGQDIFGSCNSIRACCGHQYEIKDADGQLVFKIHGLGRPSYCCGSHCCGSLEYDIIQPLYNNVVSQIIGEYVRGDKFKIIWTIKFPRGIDVRMKAVFLGLIVFINGPRTRRWHKKKRVKN